MRTTSGHATRRRQPATAACRTRPRRSAILGVAAIALGASLSGVAAPVAAQVPKLKPVRDLPALRSEPVPKTKPETPVGDFRDPPPHPAELGERRPVPKGAAFDPARSTPLDDQTTPTRRLYRNPDGTTTALVSTDAVRFQDGAGKWVEADLSLVAAPTGAWALL